MDKFKKMKKNLQLIIVLLFVAACTTQPKSKAEIITGEFLFYDNNAVLNTGSEIYGVEVDDKLHELHAQVAPIQKDSFDMVQVYIKGLGKRISSWRTWRQRAMASFPLYPSQARCFYDVDGINTSNSFIKTNFIISI